MSDKLSINLDLLMSEARLNAEELSRRIGIPATTIKKIFEKELKNYVCLMQSTTEKESTMFEFRLVQLILLDILSSDDYDMTGVARYTNTCEEVIEEVITGRNPMPSVIFFRRLIDLHRSVRRDIYETIIRKITTKYLSAA